MKTLIKVWIRKADTEYMATSMQIAGWNYTNKNIIDFFNGLEESMKEAIDKEITEREAMEYIRKPIILEQLIFPEHTDGIETIYYSMYLGEEIKKVGSR